MTQETPVKPTEDTVRLDVGRISVGANHRRRFDDARLKELAANIKAVGVLQPLLVRPHRNGGGKPSYELIAGERRLRAAKMAGLSQIPARVLDVDDQQAAEIQAFENLHREDLTAIEEAKAFNLLMRSGQHTAASLADRINKSPSYVLRAVRLVDLPADVQQLIEDGKLAPGHGHELLRTPKDEALNFARAAIRERMTVADLREAIEEKIGRSLAKAPFPKDRPYGGVAIACDSCPYNSSHKSQQDLFGKAAPGLCTNASCFERKWDAHIRDLQQKSASRYAAFKFLGVRRADLDCNDFIEGLNNACAVTLQHQGIPAVKKALQEQPARFGWCIFASRYREYEKHPIAGLVCLDSRWFDRLLPREKRSGYDSMVANSASGRAPETPKQRHIRKSVEAALLHAGAARAEKGFDKHMLGAIVNAIGQDVNTNPFPWEHYGIGDSGWNGWGAKLQKLSEPQLRGLAFMLAVNDYKSVDTKALKAVGVDVEKVKKAAKAAAEKAWEDAKAKKGAAKKG